MVVSWWIVAFLPSVSYYFSEIVHVEACNKLYYLQTVIEAVSEADNIEIDDNSGR